MDETIFHLINQQWTNRAFDFFMPIVSRADLWTPVFLVISCLLLILGGFRGRAFVLCTALALGISNLVVDPLKHVIGRARPKQVQTVRMLEMEKTHPAILTIVRRPQVRLSTPEELARSGNSFPSGHVNNNTVIAICCTMFYRRWGKWYWLVTAAVAYSRIYLGAHWPSDVAATFFLAAGETLLLLALFELTWRKFIAPNLPEMATRHPSLMNTNEN